MATSVQPAASAGETWKSCRRSGDPFGATPDYPFAAMLLSVLALDAFKSALESGYFGLVWGCQYGVLSPSFQVLGRPGPLMAVKLVNLAVAAVVVARLLRTWIPALFVQ